MSKHSGHAEGATPSNRLQNYSAGAGVFDEMQESPATPRPHWRRLMESLEQLSSRGLQSRWENGRRILREHGVTYNVYDDPHGRDHAWGLDVVPLLIAGAEWAHIEAGLIQRSRLFNLILADIYGGSQRLLRDGFVPPELVYANPAFLRPCHGIRIPDQVYLHLHACDLGRSPDGQWWVLSDRTMAASGSGYAWENRTVLSRILPEPIRDCQVQRLAAFFQRQREMLFSLAPARAKQPSIVFLSPGPHHEIYFEHAYLARHLGFPLVEGADLTVRDRSVFLKTIEGLQPVDVILRRVDDSYCDPLELRGDSLLGISGLVEATRAGNVTVANALGAGLMESPAFLAFLPNLCRHLLGEELLLPSIATWWCGQAKELRHVNEHLGSLVLKPAFAGQSLAFTNLEVPTTRRKLAKHRGELIRLIQSSPRDFVAQERLKLSRAPAWAEGKLIAVPVVVRAYVANARDSVAVLPGGLTRVPRNGDDVGASIRSGTESKDTWVLSKGPAASYDLPLVIHEPRLVASLASGIASRAADHLFWLGRYTERLEQLLRVVRCVFGRLSGEPAHEGSSEYSALADFVANLGLFVNPLDGDGERQGELSARLLALLYDPDQTSGAGELLKQIGASASAVRDRFSGDTWRILRRLEADASAHPRPGRLPLADAAALSHQLVLDLAAFNGMEMENMTRGRGWRFLDFGRRLERGVSVLKLLRAGISVRTLDASVLELVLEIADTIMTYRRQYFAAPQLPGVLAMLLGDDANPRSLGFQVRMLSEHALALPVDGNTPAAKGEQARVNALANEIRTIDLNGLIGHVTQGDAQPLLDLLGKWAADLAAVSDEITSHYFSHSVPRLS